MHEHPHPNAPRPPDFLCIGAQKAGTTWVYSVLYHCAGVFVPPIKESNYLLEASERDRDWARDYRFFQVGLREKRYRTRLLPLRDVAARLEQIEHFKAPDVDDEWYRRLFGYAREDQVAGEVCPSYLTLATGAHIRHALRLNPDLRVLVMVRDPVERFWSQVRMDVRYGRVTEQLDTLLRDEEGIREYMCFSDYMGSIERWSKLIKPGHLRLMLYDDMMDRPRALAGEILAFVGAKHGGVHCVEGRINAGVALSMTPEQRRRVLDLMRPQYAYLGGIFPDAVDRWLGGHEQSIAQGCDGGCGARDRPRVA